MDQDRPASRRAAREIAVTGIRGLAELVCETLAPAALRGDGHRRRAVPDGR